MSSPARTGRTPARRPAPSAVPVRDRRPAAKDPAPPAAPARQPATGPGHGVSHTTGAIRLRSRGTGALRTGSVRSRHQSVQPGSVRSTPVRPELRVLPAPASAPVRRPAASPSARRAPFVLLVVGLLVGTTLGVLVLNTAIAVDSLTATSLRVSNQERAKRVQELEQQVINSGAPGALASRAAKDGLVPAGTPGHLVVKPDGSSVLRGTPLPAPTPPPSASPSSASSSGAAPTTPSAPSSSAPAGPGPDAGTAAGD